MKTFVAALRRSIDVQDSKLVYVSIGSDMANTRSKERLFTQQFPPMLHKYALEHPDKQVSVILVSPVWRYEEPSILSHFSAVHSKRTVNTFIPSILPNVRIQWITDFFSQADVAHLKYFATKRPRVHFLIGDFTIDTPFLPFDEFPDLKTLLERGNVSWMGNPEHEDIRHNKQQKKP